VEELNLKGEKVREHGDLRSFYFRQTLASPLLCDVIFVFMS
jgi:hypothetical protein